MKNMLEKQRKGDDENNMNFETQSRHDLLHRWWSSSDFERNIPMVLNFFALIFGICCSILSSPEQKNTRFGKGTDTIFHWFLFYPDYQSNGDPLSL